MWELRQVLEAMGQKPTEEELFQMISEVDENMSGSIDFAEFLKVIENQKERAENFDDENDMIDAFVACGGNRTRAATCGRRRLCDVKIIKHDFGLTICCAHRRQADQQDRHGSVSGRSSSSSRSSPVHGGARSGAWRGPCQGATNFAAAASPFCESRAWRPSMHYAQVVRGCAVAI